MTNVKNDDDKGQVERVEARIPEHIVKEIQEYKKSNGLPTRNAAILELIRKGLETK